jgi:hypothetical protein
MKILIAIPILLITVLLVSCGPEDTQNQNSESVNASQTAEEYGDNDEEISASNQKEDQSDAISASAENHDTDEASSETGDDDANDRANKESLLSKYPADKIEYARVWLQVVGNTEVEELTVRHLSAGELVNPYSEDSATFSEEVIQLGGKRMADGIVTYSGNGDGTINLYNLPSHWPSPKQIDQSMEEYTEDMVTNTKQIYIEPVDNKTLISLIHKLTVQK